jgi:hypothetical protein
MNVNDRIRYSSEDYNNLEQSQMLVPLQSLSIGDFGVARFDDDQCWYRARVLISEENDYIQIVYIDFGNIELKKKDQFFPLDSKFAVLPAQAIACTLSEVSSDNSRQSLTLNMWIYSEGFLFVFFFFFNFFQAFPRETTPQTAIWPQQAVDIFKKEVLNQRLEIHFVVTDAETSNW